MLAESHKYKHDRSNRINDSENERIINFVQTENGIVYMGYYILMKEKN
jgi:hypothetical protein